MISLSPCPPPKSPILVHNPRDSNIRRTIAEIVRPMIKKITFEKQSAPIKNPLNDTMRLQQSKLRDVSIRPQISAEISLDVVDLSNVFGVFKKQPSPLNVILREKQEIHFEFCKAPNTTRYHRGEVLIPKFSWQQKMKNLNVAPVLNYK